jgi:Resolvase, N terminal domain
VTTLRKVVLTQHSLALIFWSDVRGKIRLRNGGVNDHRYARVSTQEQSLHAQIEELKTAGAERIFADKAAGSWREWPELTKFKRRSPTVTLSWSRA